MTLLEMLNQDLNLVGKIFLVCGLAENGGTVKSAGQWGKILKRFAKGTYRVQIEDSVYGLIYPQLVETRMVTLTDMADWQFYNARGRKHYENSLNKELRELWAAYNAEQDALEAQGIVEVDPVTGRVLVQLPAWVRIEEFRKAHPGFLSPEQKKRQMQWDFEQQCLRLELALTRPWLAGKKSA